MDTKTTAVTSRCVWTTNIGMNYLRLTRIFKTDWESIKWKERITWSRWWHGLDGSFLHNVREHRVSWTVYVWACHRHIHTISALFTNSVLRDSDNQATVQTWYLLFSTLFFFSFVCLLLYVPKCAWRHFSFKILPLTPLQERSMTPSQTHSQPAAMSYRMNSEPPPHTNVYCKWACSGTVNCCHSVKWNQQ